MTLFPRQPLHHTGHCQYIHANSPANSRHITYRTCEARLQILHVQTQSTYLQFPFQLMLSAHIHAPRSSCNIPPWNANLGSRICGGHVDQVPAPPAHPLPCTAGTQNNAVARRVWRNVRVVRENERRVATIDFFEQNELLAVLGPTDQRFLLAARLVVDACLRLPNDLVAIVRVQNPAFCAGPDRNLHKTYVGAM